MEFKMPDQRSLYDQLKDLYVLANRNGLYDAADYVRTVVERMDRAQAQRDSGECSGCGYAPCLCDQQ